MTTTTTRLQRWKYRNKQKLYECRIRLPTKDVLGEGLMGIILGESLHSVRAIFARNSSE